MGSGRARELRGRGQGRSQAQDCPCLCRERARARPLGCETKEPSLPPLCRPGPSALCRGIAHTPLSRCPGLPCELPADTI